MNSTTTKGRGRKKGTSPVFLGQFEKSLHELKTAKQNDQLYDPFGIANLDDRDLTISIRDNGIQQPLTVSLDGFVLSGHRRFAAATYLGLETVPVQVVDTWFQDLSATEQLAVLRLHNQQRTKSPGELIREKMLDIDPAAAHQQLVMRRNKAARQCDSAETNVDMGRVKKRARITTKDFLRAVQKVVKDNRDYWPLTVRRVHYLLLNDPPLRHDKKPERYANDQGNYKALTKLLSRARLFGLVDMQAIEDGTRPIQLGGGFSTCEEFIGQETENYLTGYTRNLMQGQPHHIEIMLEKNALRTVIERVARQYCIPMTTGRGFSSLCPRADIAERFRDSGKDKLVLLMLTDHDPDGEQIAASFASSMRDDFGIDNIQPVKVALTAVDVLKYELPSDIDAKPSSPNYAKFVEKHGTKAVELDAMTAELLQSKLREAIESVIDVDEYNAQIDLERKDAAVIEAHRRVVFAATRGDKHAGGADHE